MSVEIIERPLTGVTPTMDGDHDRFTHVVAEGFWPQDADGNRIGDFVSNDNSVIDGVLNQKPIKALCGKYWVPMLATPYPLCPTCKDICQRNGWELPAF